MTCRTPRPPGSAPDADLDAAIAKAEAHCDLFPGTRGPPRRAGRAAAVHLEKEELAELRARRDRLRRHL